MNFRTEIHDYRKIQSIGKTIGIDVDSKLDTCQI